MQDVHGTEKMCVCISLCMWTRRRDPTGLRLIPEADYLPFDEISLKLDLCVGILVWQIDFAFIAI